MKLSLLAMLLVLPVCTALGGAKSTLEADTTSGWLLKESDSKAKLKSCTFAREKSESSVSLYLELKSESDESETVFLNPVSAITPNHLPFGSNGKTEIRSGTYMLGYHDFSFVYDGGSRTATVAYTKERKTTDFLGESTETELHRYTIYVDSSLKTPRRIIGSIHRKKSGSDNAQVKIMELDCKFE